MDDLDSIGAGVELHVYDLTKGLASLMSPLLLGKQLEGLWHTGVVAYGREYFFGAAGVQSVRPSGTVLGEPDRIITLGDTFIPYPVFLDYVLGLGQTCFSADRYDLFHHNCNTFSDEVSHFLCGAGIPKYILDLPHEILNTPLGATIQPILERLSTQPRQSNTPTSVANPAADLGIFSFLSPNALRPSLPQQSSRDTQQLTNACAEGHSSASPVKQEKKKKKPKKERRKSSQMADSEAVSAPNGSEEHEVHIEERTEKPVRNVEKSVADLEEQERLEEEAKKKHREPPIIFRDAVDLQSEFDAMVDLIGNVLNPEEQQSLEELHQYMLEDEGSWALGDGFLNFVGRILHDKSLQTAARVHVLHVLSVAALKDDVILLLHQDRREHVLMNYAQDVDRLTPEEQQALALFMANLFENVSSSEWLLYITEWQYCNNTLSNIRVTTKVAVNCLLSDNAALQDRGSAILHNLACKEVFDDVAIELTMALLQYFNSNPPEEHLYRCMKALHRFCLISQQDVPQLIQMIGPEPTKFRGASERVDQLIAEINKKLR